MKSLIKREQGFTLIEIVIVLAIAAAIMLMVFLAVTGARRSQRDTQRRGDASRMAATLEQYAANNGGNYPDAIDTADANGPKWFTTYITGNFNAPGGGSYSAGAFTAAATVSAVPALNTVNLAVSGTSYQVCIGSETGGDVCASSK